MIFFILRIKPSLFGFKLRPQVNLSDDTCQDFLATELQKFNPSSLGDGLVLSHWLTVYRAKKPSGTEQVSAQRALRKRALGVRLAGGWLGS